MDRALLTSSRRQHQNYPNPFNPTTNFRYGLRVRLAVYNTLGQTVASLVDRIQGAGYHEVQWYPLVASGIYFYKLEAVVLDKPLDSFITVRKMLFMR
ncbi:MAG: T9SS type A sorting domain-containing protein [Ignavibacteriae bacterium]|nr:T9SS type A sorting domain-containing protein [Ignavibacteria bacterium]MBI3365127.1 T9SS type A sorting domain-containing protein [Ignavibacteriota bacterium]